jgi:hypothetical protein
MKEICGRCRFWEFTHKPEDDYAWGECRRHSPRPTSFVLSIIAKNTGGTAWATEEIAKIEHHSEDDYLVESTEQFEINEWPHVQCDEWCGEFERAIEGPLPSGNRPYIKGRLNEAALWEKEVGLAKE